MAKCPICENDLDDILCQCCGYDASLDYEQYPTVARISFGIISTQALRENARILKAEYETDKEYFRQTETGQYPLDAYEQVSAYGNQNARGRLVFERKGDASMSTWICYIEGNKGRKIAVYDNKCVITTDATGVSLLTNNPLGGEKTIFYIDVVGVQFKESGLTNGYLQLETAAMQTSNGNVFSENAYVYDANTGTVNNTLVKLLQKYIIDRIEGYKYRKSPSEESLTLLMKELEKRNLPRNKEIERKFKEREQLIAEREERERLKKEEQEKQNRAKRAEEFKKNIKDQTFTGVIQDFLLEVNRCNSIKEIRKLWDAESFTGHPNYEKVSEAIKRAELVERRYGESQRDTEEFIREIMELLQVWVL